MAVVINSTSSSPSPATVIVGSPVSFSVDAVDSTSPSTPLLYQWEVSSNTGSSWVEISGATSETYTINSVDISQNNYLFRAKVTSSVNPLDFAYSDIIVLTVSQRPVIIIFNQTLEERFIVLTGANLSFFVDIRIFNIDRSSSSAVNQASILWQRSQDGITWQSVPLGSNVSQSDSLVESGGLFDKKSQLVFTNINSSVGSYYYRAIVDYPNSENGPINVFSNYPGGGILLLINPTLTIVQDTTLTPSTITSYRQTIAGSGEVELRISVLPSAGSFTILSYTWEYTYDGINYAEIPLSGESSDFNIFTVPLGTNTNSPVVLINRVKFSSPLCFRCRINGSLGETEVISTPSCLTIQQYIDLNSQYINFSDVSVIEDRYGDISNRQQFTRDPIRTAGFSGYLDLRESTGLHGLNNVRVTFQRKLSSEANFSDVGTTFVGGKTSYVDAGDVETDYFGFSYISRPLRISLDNQSEYRIKAEVLNPLSGFANPVFSTPVTVTVFPTAFIDTQPVSTIAYTSQSVSLSVLASSSSGQQVSYKWQRSTDNIGWFDVRDGSFLGSPQNYTYSGSNTNTLAIGNLPFSSSFNFIYYRCIVDVPGSLSSLTTNVVTVQILSDDFQFISSLNDVTKESGESVTFTATAISSSGTPPTPQWQFSSDNINWIDISGATLNNYVITSVSQLNQGYYRCKFTSFGKSILYTNSAFLNVIVRVIILEEDLPSSATFIENRNNNTIFSVRGSASNGQTVQYQWQVQYSGSLIWEDLGAGSNGSSPTSRFYSFPLLSKPTFNGAKIRCVLTANNIPQPVTSSVMTLTVRRIFSYTAQPERSIIVTGNTFSWNLQPIVTGGSPTYRWQISSNNINWTNLSDGGVVGGPIVDGSLTSALTITNLDATYNNQYIRCEVTLSSVDEFVFYRVPATTVNPQLGFTVSTVIIVASSAPIGTRYTKETAKTGAAIGTVICIPKPFDFVVRTSGPSSGAVGASVTGLTGGGGLFSVAPNTTITAVNTATNEVTLSNPIIVSPLPGINPALQGAVSFTATGTAATVNVLGVGSGGSNVVSNIDPAIMASLATLGGGNIISDDRRNWGTSLTNRFPDYPLIDAGNSSNGITTDPSNTIPSTVANSGEMTPAIGPYSDQDRFPGFIEMRGQVLRCVDFPELARILEDRYGGIIAGTYPDYEHTDWFALPNLYGKRLMGTGSVDNNTGSPSVVPKFGPSVFLNTLTNRYEASTANAGIDEAGSIGGLYVYNKTDQLPVGSPGDQNNDGDTNDYGESGNAGTTYPFTFSIGRFSTVGWEDCNASLPIRFAGYIEYAVGELSNSQTGVPLHDHSRINTVGVVSLPETYGRSYPYGNSDANSVRTVPIREFGQITAGPDGIPENDRGRPHSHGLQWSGSTLPVANVNPGGGGDVAVTYDTPGIQTVDIDPGESIVTFEVQGGGGGAGGGDASNPGGDGGRIVRFEGQFDLGAPPVGGHRLIVGVGGAGGGGSTGGGAAGGTGGSSPTYAGSINTAMTGGNGGRAGGSGSSGGGGGGGGASWVICTTYNGSQTVVLAAVSGSGGGAGGGLNPPNSIPPSGRSQFGNVNVFTPSSGSPGGDRNGDGAGGGGGSGGSSGGAGGTAASSDTHGGGGRAGETFIQTAAVTNFTSSFVTATEAKGNRGTRGNNGRNGLVALSWQAAAPPAGGNAGANLNGVPEDNHNDNIGQSTGTREITGGFAMQTSPGATGNIIAPPAEIVMNRASATNFDNNLQFFLRNNEDIPILSPAFRLKYMIKAF